ncbi:MarR family transcriptional regulator [Cryobacterium sp. TMT1-62]|uniref:helix-turn-helix transcriptional regulator n=1 Tax=unclassified Cryobacterium TaxID=2649013 RepID=UPI00106DB888|nr:MULTISPECIES: helix-turn-helix domain-containing protein [unclassified Cryobacterium]TFC36339.1 MarR family transcriptional regulator [Cryobacterium sp. TMT2-14]TFC52416.1 MarR family transcriptional regulator [Cryobacterium sp. TMT2-17-1]TFC65193.1 MarR family transcriptional regulator [Cryobacterium sp. TMT2-4]TFD36553.1 MarR family transcriptional regulator [Cryobacterium sp. TMT1-62]
MNASDPDQEPRPTPGSDARWTFLTNHAHVLVTIARDPQCRMREVASRVGVTERGAQKIIADLVASGYITRTRVGRRNSYQIAPGRLFRHPVSEGHELDELLAVLVPVSPPKLDT